MAFQAAPVWTITYSFLDESGSRATTTAYARSALAIQDVETRAGALRAAIDALSGATVMSYTISRSWVEDTPAAPSAGSRVERKGRFIWGADAYESRMDIPAIIDAVVDPTGRIERTNPLVLAYGGVMLLDFVGDFTDSRGVSLDLLKQAYEAFSRSTKKRLPSRR